MRLASGERVDGGGGGGQPAEANGRRRRSWRTLLLPRRRRRRRNLHVAVIYRSAASCEICTHKTLLTSRPEAALGAAAW